MRRLKETFCVLQKWDGSWEKNEPGKRIVKDQEGGASPTFCRGKKCQLHSRKGKGT